MSYPVSPYETLTKFIFIKEFWGKEIFGLGILGQKEFSVEKFSVKKNLVEEFFAKGNSGLSNFWSKGLLDGKILALDLEFIFLFLSNLVQFF